MNTPNSALQELTLLWLKKLVCSLNSGIEQNRTEQLISDHFYSFFHK